ncbi:MAG: phosphoenolpyruvate carboxykinase (ATP) [Phycisphaerales bacterium]|nr:phosphoenolpyruvate carboxykinase (ATP) [Phycisphaerales bacterium]
MTTATPKARLDFDNVTLHSNLSTSALVEMSLRRQEGMLAANGALACDTGSRTGRSPNDKYLEDTPGIHDSIEWGKVNKPISSENFAKLEDLVMKYLRGKDDLFEFEGFAGADPDYRLSVRVITEFAWHSLFARTLFIEPTSQELKKFAADWTILNAARMPIENPESYGLDSGVGILQSLEQKKVIIFGTEYAGEIKKSIFYAMNYDMPAANVFPMHCSANVDDVDPSNVALFFGLSGTGKTTLSADPHRPLIGDDEHGWSDNGVFNFEGGCYAKCIHLTRAGEPQIWDAIRFGSVLENVVLDPETRLPDYDSSAKTENTRVTYPVSFIPDAKIPSVGAHPKHIIFLTADAFGVLPPVSRLTRDQAMYYFVNGYTSKLAGTEAGVTEPVPNFSPCYGGPFLPRPPMVYADLLSDRIEQHGSDVWLLNTGWTGGPYGQGQRFELKWTRLLVTMILSGELLKASYQEHEIFGLHMPKAAGDVPVEMLSPRGTWQDVDAYDLQAIDLAKRFHANDALFHLPEDIRQAGPKIGREG